MGDVVARGNASLNDILPKKRRENETDAVIMTTHLTNGPVLEENSRESICSVNSDHHAHFNNNNGIKTAKSSCVSNLVVDSTSRNGRLSEACDVKSGTSDDVSSGITSDVSDEDDKMCNISESDNCSQKIQNAMDTPSSITFSYEDAKLMSKQRNDSPHARTVDCESKVNAIIEVSANVAVPDSSNTTQLNESDISSGSEGETCAPSTYFQSSNVKVSFDDKSVDNEFTSLSLSDMELVSNLNSSYFGYVDWFDGETTASHTQDKRPLSQLSLASKQLFIQSILISSKPVKIETIQRLRVSRSTLLRIIDSIEKMVASYNRCYKMYKTRKLRSSLKRRKRKIVADDNATSYDDDTKKAKVQSSSESKCVINSELSSKTSNEEPTPPSESNLNPFVYCKLGHLNLLLEDYKKAYSAFSKFFSLMNPKRICDPDFYYGWGLVSFHYERFDTAIVAFRKCLTYCPVYVRAKEVFIRLGIMYKMIGDFSTSINYFDMAFNMKGQTGVISDNEKIHKFVSMDLDEIVKCEDLDREIDKGGIIPPSSNLDGSSCHVTDHEIVFHKGHLHQLHGHYSSAIQMYQQLLSEDKEKNTTSLVSTKLSNSLRAEIHRQLGWIYFNCANSSSGPNTPTGDKLSRTEKAIFHLRFALEIEPRSGSTLYLLGRCYASINRVHDAFIAYRNSVDKSESNADTWCSIGVLYQQQNQPMDALQAYICAVQLDKHHTSAWLNLALLYESCNVSQWSDVLTCYLNAKESVDHIRSVKSLRRDHHLFSDTFIERRRRSMHGPLHIDESSINSEVTSFRRASSSSTGGGGGRNNSGSSGNSNNSSCGGGTNKGGRYTKHSSTVNQPNVQTSDPVSSLSGGGNGLTNSASSLMSVSIQHRITLLSEHGITPSSHKSSGGPSSSFLTNGVAALSKVSKGQLPTVSDAWNLPVSNEMSVMMRSLSVYKSNFNSLFLSNNSQHHVHGSTTTNPIVPVGRGGGEKGSGPSPLTQGQMQTLMYLQSQPSLNVQQTHLMHQLMAQQQQHSVYLASISSRGSQGINRPTSSSSASINNSPNSNKTDMLLATLAAGDNLSDKDLEALICQSEDLGSMAETLLKQMQVDNPQTSTTSSTTQPTSSCSISTPNSKSRCDPTQHSYSVNHEMSSSSSHQHANSAEILASRSTTLDKTESSCEEDSKFDFNKKDGAKATTLSKEGETSLGKEEGMGEGQEYFPLEDAQLNQILLEIPHARKYIPSPADEVEKSDSPSFLSSDNVSSSTFPYTITKFKHRLASESSGEQRLHGLNTLNHPTSGRHLLTVKNSWSACALQSWLKKYMCVDVGTYAYNEQIKRAKLHKLVKSSSNLSMMSKQDKRNSLMSLTSSNSADLDDLITVSNVTTNSFQSVRKEFSPLLQNNDLVLMDLCQDDEGENDCSGDQSNHLPLTPLLLGDQNYRHHSLMKSPPDLIANNRRAKRRRMRKAILMHENAIKMLNMSDEAGLRSLIAQEPESDSSSSTTTPKSNISSDFSFKLSPPSIFVDNKKDVSDLNISSILDGSHVGLSHLVEQGNESKCLPNSITTDTSHHNKSNKYSGDVSSFVVRNLATTLRMDLGLFSSKTIHDTLKCDSFSSNKSSSSGSGSDNKYLVDVLIEGRHQRMADDSSPDYLVSGSGGTLSPSYVMHCNKSVKKVSVSLTQFIMYQIRHFYDSLREDQPSKAKQQAAMSSTSTTRLNDIRLGYFTPLSDTTRWRSQLSEIHCKMPAWCRPVASSNLLSHMSHQVNNTSSSNQQQMLLKQSPSLVSLQFRVPFARTYAQLQQTTSLVDLNVGPGDMEWFLVGPSQLSKLRLVVRQQFGFSGWLNFTKSLNVMAMTCTDHRNHFEEQTNDEINCNGGAGLGHVWPSIKQLITNEVYVYKFIQKPGDLVWIEPNSIFWTQSTGWSNSVRYQVAPLTVHHYLIMWTSYKYHTLMCKYNSFPKAARDFSVATTIPFIRLSWNVARNVRVKCVDLCEAIRTVLYSSFISSIHMYYLLHMSGVEAKFQYRNLVLTPSSLKQPRLFTLNQPPLRYCSVCNCELFCFMFARENKKRRDRDIEINIENGKDDTEGIEKEKELPSSINSSNNNNKYITHCLTCAMLLEGFNDSNVDSFAESFDDTLITSFLQEKCVSNPYFVVQDYQLTDLMSTYDVFHSLTLIAHSSAPQTSVTATPSLLSNSSSTNSINSVLSGVSLSNTSSIEKSVLSSSVSSTSCSTTSQQANSILSTLAAVHQAQAAAAAINKSGGGGDISSNHSNQHSTLKKLKLLSNGSVNSESSASSKSSSNSSWLTSKQHMMLLNSAGLLNNPKQQHGSNNLTNGSVTPSVVGKHTSSPSLNHPLKGITGTCKSSYLPNNHVAMDGNGKPATTNSAAVKTSMLFKKMMSLAASSPSNTNTSSSIVGSLNLKNKQQLHPLIPSSTKITPTSNSKNHQSPAGLGVGGASLSQSNNSSANNKHSTKFVNNLIHNHHKFQSSTSISNKVNQSAGSLSAAKGGGGSKFISSSSGNSLVPVSSVPLMNGGGMHTTSSTSTTATSSLTDSSSSSSVKKSAAALVTLMQMKMQQQKAAAAVSSLSNKSGSSLTVIKTSSSSSASTPPSTDSSTSGCLKFSNPTKLNVSPSNSLTVTSSGSFKGATGCLNITPSSTTSSATCSSNGTNSLVTSSSTTTSKSSTT